MLRLTAATVASVRSDVLVPRYDRSGSPTITHLGVGAFARAHLGVYADDLLARGWPAAIRGISLRSSRAEEQLGPQDGLYSLTEREPESDTPLRVLGAITTVATGATAAVDAIADPATTVVTLTVTEKGYEAGADQTSAPAVVARGLLRRGTSVPPPVIVSLDNVVDNGDVLRRAVVEAASALDPGSARHIEANVAFPSSVVDRVVPATRPDDLDQVTERLGLCDHAAVAAERHRSWVIEDVEGLPPLGDVGVEVVADHAPFQRRKLWLLNGPHSAIAYGGLVAGATTIADASRHAVVHDFVRGYVDDVLAIVDLPASSAPRAFADEALRRFANPLLGDACTRIAGDSSRKFPQRLFPVVRARRDRGLDTTRAAMVAAAWLATAGGIEVQGRRLPAIDDPAVDELEQLARRGTRRDLCRAAVGDQTDEPFVDEVERALERLTREGIGAFA